jgi:hypothetical protein
MRRTSSSSSPSSRSSSCSASRQRSPPAVTAAPSPAPASSGRCPRPSPTSTFSRPPAGPRRRHTRLPARPAMCDKHGADVADVGPGGDWNCLMSWTDPEVPMQMLNKVPEVTIWFWDHQDPVHHRRRELRRLDQRRHSASACQHALLFTGDLRRRARWQMRRGVRPHAYWLTVVVVSVDGHALHRHPHRPAHVPLWISTAVFSALLAIVFGIWYARERTLSIHSINTLPREAFYWLAVLVTFALGTAPATGPSS